MRNAIRVICAFLVTMYLVAPYPSRAQEQTISSDNYFGCTSKDYFEKIASYAADKDLEAFKKALLAGLLDGTCTMFKRGETVYLEDTSIFSGLVKVRRRGETLEYWTAMEAVK